jgi:hypothetical protein
MWRQEDPRKSGNLQFIVINMLTYLGKKVVAGYVSLALVVVL